MVNEYNVLPMISFENKYLESELSVYKNPFLRCRWFHYLNQLPGKSVRIKVYKDYYQERIDNMKSHDYGRNLTGLYYGRDNKLQPVPVNNMRLQRIVKSTSPKIGGHNLSTALRNTKPKQQKNDVEYKRCNKVCCSSFGYKTPNI